MSAPRPAVFVDRDGTLIHDAGYLSQRDELRWYPWTLDALRLLNRAGYLIFVVTNQSGVALGLFTEDFVKDTHSDMDRYATAAGVRIDGWFYCPHHTRAVRPEFQGPCGCRKPALGMIEAAEREHAIDIARSFVIGDRQSDVDLGVAMGGRGILVTTGVGAADLARLGGAMPGASCIAPELMSAVSWILRNP